MSKEIQTKQESSPAVMIAAAVQQGTDLEQLEKVLELQERWEANEARKAYHKDMAEFKKNAPIIEKDRKVKFQTSKGTTQYNHASLFNVTNTITEALSKNGFSASWDIDQNGTIKVTCKITHAQGHTEITQMSAEKDATGQKNNIQQIASTISYLERYTLLALTGLSTKEMDDDGQALKEKPETKNSDLGQEINRLVKIAFKNPDHFKPWRIDVGLPETPPSEWSDKEKNEIIMFLKKEIEGKNANN